MSRTVNRRQFLTAAGIGAVAAGTVTGCDSLFTPKGPVSGATGTVMSSAVELPPRFDAELPKVPVLEPVRSAGGVDHYEVTQRAADAQILPGFTTQIWGYNGIFPGPTIEARSGRQIEVTIHNELPVPTSTHLHGGVNPHDSDGYPTDLIVPDGYDKRVDAAMLSMHARQAAGTGNGPQQGRVPQKPDPQVWSLHPDSRTYRYPLEQRAAPLWYHDHRMDFSGPQLWRGLVGSAFVRDEEEDFLDLAAGDKELSLLICDRSFDADGQLQYPSKDPQLHDPGGVKSAYMDGVLGDVLLVNGAPWPVKRVANTKYRLRLLNASNARVYQLTFRAGNRELPITQIGSDGGLLVAPQRLPSIPMSPAERFDVVVDFSALPVGTEVVVANSVGSGPAGQVMKFVVDRAETDTTTIPDRLCRSYRRLDRKDAVGVRTFDFRLSTGDIWTVNGEPFDPRESLATPKLGTVELWRFTSDFNHPVHTHLAHFQVHSRDGGKPNRHDAGWKDTVNVTPYGVVEVLVEFTGFRGKYLVHCHNLEHEDMAMMANFTVV
ncbi:multicopper oxidase family protein [Arthrobacter castelli]|uniref:multicopper oxidase family protein n=1 Tax=Arthrobacter castelli TaxID=271431 RepID=UPI0004200C54|nr:multicopper oxidase domain-containing protein [Arthrobacter castelli]